MQKLINLFTRIHGWILSSASWIQFRSLHTDPYWYYPFIYTKVLQVVSFLQWVLIKILHEFLTSSKGAHELLYIFAVWSTQWLNMHWMVTNHDACVVWFSYFLCLGPKYSLQHHVQNNSFCTFSLHCEGLGCHPRTVTIRIVLIRVICNVSDSRSVDKKIPKWHTEISQETWIFTSF
jgi:hypothetical protein